MAAELRGAFIAFDSDDVRIVNGDCVVIGENALALAPMTPDALDRLATLAASAAAVTRELRRLPAIDQGGNLGVESDFEHARRLATNPEPTGAES